ncbi:hypothetical protein NDA11_006172 [Ustilago hordei]|nr:hypothetical protein NDA10_000044 [Ustilago hordei]KAJ1576989.1 hypothetical protein NDA15_004674 [Ustilago hordei]KAJ1578774.1 hypothetical protein NDA12_006732 [Ustilago hordei]KAJ1584196.1 hypothetical protein NDA11_006172 [Ustilago hordei]
MVAAWWVIDAVNTLQVPVCGMKCTLGCRALLDRHDDGHDVGQNEGGFTVGNRPPSLTAKRYKQPPTSNSPPQYSSFYLSLALCRSSKMLLTRPLTILSIALLFFAPVDAVFGFRSYASVVKGPSRHPSPSDPLDALPSNSEFENALLTRPPSPRSPSNPLWVPSPNPDPFSTAKHYMIPKITTYYGRTFGPLPIGRSKFHPTPYPFTIPHFQNTYTRQALWPVDFDVAHVRQLLDGEKMYRPEPHILKNVRKAVHTPLRLHGWEPGVKGQGEFLWPPTIIHPTKAISGLEMPVKTRLELHSELMSNFKDHSQIDSEMWHLTVETREGKRNVLMSKANAERFVDGAEGEKNDHDFWMFHEAFRKPHLQKEVGAPGLAFLGGMYLPKDAIKKLEEAGSVRPAFQSVIGHLH